MNYICDFCGVEYPYHEIQNHVHTRYPFYKTILEIRKDIQSRGGDIGTIFLSDKLPVIHILFGYPVVHVKDVPRDYLDVSTRWKGYL